MEAAKARLLSLLPGSRNEEWRGATIDAYTAYTLWRALLQRVCDWHDTQGKESPPGARPPRTPKDSDTLPIVLDRFEVRIGLGGLSLEAGIWARGSGSRGTLLEHERFLHRHKCMHPEFSSFWFLGTDVAHHLLHRFEQSEILSGLPTCMYDSLAIPGASWIGFTRRGWVTRRG